jgi:hypothetical protein
VLNDKLTLIVVLYRAGKVDSVRVNGAYLWQVQAGRVDSMSMMSRLVASCVESENGNNIDDDALVPLAGQITWSW